MVLESIDLWYLFVEVIFGGFWLSIFGIAFMIFLIMAVLGKMSGLTVVYYLLLFFMTMAIGWGNRWIAVIIFSAILVWFFISLKKGVSEA